MRKNLLFIVVLCMLVFSVGIALAISDFNCINYWSDNCGGDQAPYIRSQPIQLAADQMQKCLTCCATRLNACGNDGRCNIFYQNCVANCNSHGETPSDWRCW